MGKSFNAMGSSPRATPRLIALMSLQPAIPGRVALQQSPLALRQPRRSSAERESLNRKNHQTAKCSNIPCLTLGGRSRLRGHWPPATSETQNHWNLNRREREARKE